MLLRRLIYLLSLAGCALFFIAYRLWFAWFALLALLCLPLFSLLLSLLTMITARLKLPLSGRITLGTERALTLRCSSLMPAPVWRCRLLVERPMTAEKWVMKEGESLPTEHCGTLFYSFQKVRIYDYLGLFRLPMKHDSGHTLQVWPQPIPVKLPAGFTLPVRTWHPKWGGGFAENHELRLYRPGDNIRQIHWKLSAKTGSPILRQPMQPNQTRLIVHLELSGTNAELDRKLGRLLWLGTELLTKELVFDVTALTGKGMLRWSVVSGEDFDDMMESLLRCPPASDVPGNTASGSTGWRYYIGGAPDET